MAAERPGRRRPRFEDEPSPGPPFSRAVTDVLRPRLGPFLPLQSQAQLRGVSRQLRQAFAENPADEPVFFVEEWIRGNKWGNPSHPSTRNIPSLNHFGRHSGLWPVSELRQVLIGSLLDLQAGRGPRILD